MHATWSQMTPDVFQVNLNLSRSGLLNKTKLKVLRSSNLDSTSSPTRLVFHQNSSIQKEKSNSFSFSMVINSCWNLFFFFSKSVEHFIIFYCHSINKKHVISHGFLIGFQSNRRYGDAASMPWKVQRLRTVANSCREKSVGQAAERKLRFFSDIGN